jgi:sulfatase maturation enzyme AslB (radical SAM superfamily)
MLSIEITRECPLSCPGCYAYGADHLGGDITLTQVSDFRGDQLVDGVVGLVRKHKPLHVTLVGGEPMVRHRELSRILPQLSQMGIYTLVVTSGIIPIPMEWMSMPGFAVAVSIDGLPEHHDIRRKPATYERILGNLQGRTVNVHWTIVQSNMERPNYREEYVRFWNSRTEIDRILVSTYSPQLGEKTPEMLTPESRRQLSEELAGLARAYPKLFWSDKLSQALLKPPKSPNECIYSKMSINYTADLDQRVEPCVFGGSPDCSQCGCAFSVGAHRIGDYKIAGILPTRYLVEGSVKIGKLVAAMDSKSHELVRWSTRPATKPQPAPNGLVNIQFEE